MVAAVLKRLAAAAVCFRAPGLPSGAARRTLCSVPSVGVTPLRVRLAPRHAASFSTGAQQDEPPAKSPLNALPGPLRDNLVGMSQVVFCNSPLAGGLILAGLFAGDPWLGACSAVSLASATAMARLAAVDDDTVSNGMASYNGALVGCAFAAFLPGSWDPAVVLASAAGGAFTPILAVALNNTLSMPQWTLAFNFTVLPPLFYHQSFNQPATEDAPAVRPMTASLCAIPHALLSSHLSRPPRA